jgi:hypothetical protein
MVTNVRSLLVGVLMLGIVVMDVKDQNPGVSFR